MKAQEFFNQHKGNYTFKSPYHKNKRLPFNLLGVSGDRISVYTVEYKGWTKYDHYGDYTVESLESLLPSFKKVKV